jgi:hypothetical protein
MFCLCFKGQMPNAMNFQQYGYGNPNMAMNINPQLNHDNLLRIVQEMKLKVRLFWKVFNV